MSATGTPTPNIGLRIPLGTDPASVDDINYNSNLIDTKLGAVGNDSVQDQIDELNSNIISLLGSFKLYSGMLNQNDVYIDDVVNIDSTNFRGLLIAYYDGITWGDTNSMFFVQRNGNHNWFGVAQMYKGTGARAVTVSSDGKLLKGADNTYNPTIFLLRLKT